MSSTKRSAPKGLSAASSKKQKQKPKQKADESAEPPSALLLALSPDSAASLSAAFKSSTPLSDRATGSEVIASPFSIAVLDGLFSAELLQAVKSELDSEEWFQLQTDAAEFFETDDLARLDTENIVKLRKMMAGREFRDLLAGLTGLNLSPASGDGSGPADATAQRFPSNAYHLPHTDDIEIELEDSEKGPETGRRLAFILFMVPEGWAKEHGGRVEFFASDENGLKEVEASVVPRNGRIVVFEPRQGRNWRVSENLSNLDVFSVRGVWFLGLSTDREQSSLFSTSPGYLHGPLPTPLAAPVSASTSPAASPLHSNSLDLATLISPKYLTPKLAEEISDVFIERSEADLRGFLVKEQYDAIAAQLASGSPIPVGPANERSYSLLKNPTADKESPLARFVDLATSEAFGKYLTSLTNLDLASVEYEVRYIEAGSYEKLPASPSSGATLDVTLCFFEKLGGEWPEEWGGAHHYSTLSGEELLVLFPYDNALSLVYREKGVERYTRYVNHRADFGRWEVCLRFGEVEREEEESEDEGEESEEMEEEDDGDEKDDGQEEEEDEE
jgi:hypothetical protein